MVPKLEEFSVEELQKQLNSKKIDKKFLAEYIVERDKVYNKLVDKLNDLERENQEYKEVIDKAIEYIESNPLVLNRDYHYFVNDLIQMEENFKDMSFIRTLLAILKEVE